MQLIFVPHAKAATGCHLSRGALRALERALSLTAAERTKFIFFFLISSRNTLAIHLQMHAARNSRNSLQTSFEKTHLQNVVVEEQLHD